MAVNQNRGLLSSQIKKLEFEEDIKPEFVADIKPEFVADIKPEFEEDIKPQFVADIKPEFEEDIKPEFVTEIKNEFVAEFVPEFEEDIKPKLVADIKPELVAKQLPYFVSAIQPILVTDSEPDSEPECVADSGPRPITVSDSEPELWFSAARVSIVASPQVSNVASQQVSYVASPQVSNVASPRVSNVASPQVSNVASQQVSNVASPQVSIVASPQVSYVASPQVSNVASVFEQEKDGGIHVCYKCHNRFAHADQLIQHTIQKHMTNQYLCDKKRKESCRPHSCLVCHNRFKTETDVLQHTNSFHPEVKCNKCEFVSRRKKAMSQHRRRCSTNMQEMAPRKAKRKENYHHSCLICYKKYKTETDVLQHTNSAHPVFNCNKCGFVSRTKTAMSQHRCSPTTNLQEISQQTVDQFRADKQRVNQQAVTQLDEPHVSDICSKRFTHGFAVTESEQFPCDQCVHVELSLHGLSSHKKKRHFSERCAQSNHATVEHQLDERRSKRVKRDPKVTNSHTCLVCFKNCANEIILLEHIKTHPPFQCDECEFSCRLQRELVRHKHKFNHKLPFVCHRCDWQGQTKKKLIVHLRKHKKGEVPEGEYPYTCCICHFKTKTRIDLRRHRTVHPPLNCDKCDFTCKFKKQLVHHLDTYNHKLSFLCSKCDWQGATREELVVHRGSHGKRERNFACEVCGKKYVNRVNFTKHMAKHTGDKAFTCEVCSKKFKNLKDIKQHKRAAHT